MLKDNALDINDKKSPDTNWRNENISKYGNISFTRLYSYISLHVHLHNYKSINLLKGGSTKTTLNIRNDYHRQETLLRKFCTTHKNTTPLIPCYHTAQFLALCVSNYA